MIMTFFRMTCCYEIIQRPWLISVFCLSNQIAGKRDKEQEQEAQEWIETITGEPFAKDTFEDSLRDGILLCKLMNKLHPGIIQKISVSGGDYKMMDNISQFQRAATHYGVGDVDLFNANDLWDMKNIALVTQTIYAVARAVSLIVDNIWNDFV